MYEMDYTEKASRRVSMLSALALALSGLTACFLSCTAPICDDCIHPALIVTIRDTQTQGALTRATSIEVVRDGVREVVTDTNLTKASWDSSFQIGASHGLYSVTIAIAGYDTVRIAGASVARDPACGVPVTRSYTATVSPLSGPAKRAEASVYLRAEGVTCG